jgi:hypothetical protein
MWRIMTWHEPQKNLWHEMVITRCQHRRSHAAYSQHLADDSESAPLPHLEKEKGKGCLQVWLFFGILTVAYSFIVFYQLVNLVTSNYEIASHVPITLVSVLGMVLLLNIVALFAIWRRKKWGVFLFAAASFTSPVFESFLGTMMLRDWIAPFVQIALLYFAVRSQWEHFT